MGIFDKKHEGGLMDTIRCDKDDYLIWKWQPAGVEEGEQTKKEIAIRWGSSLRVKDGEVAAFVYKQKDGTMQDWIEGPFDETIKTANFPILANIMGAAFGGGTPFQAEVYFINLAGIIQIKFAVPYFDVFDPRFVDFSVPVAVRGSISFKITDYKAFVKLHRLISFNLEQFKSQVQDAVKKYVKSIVANCPVDNQIVVTQMDKKILQINELAENYIKPRLAADFGVTVSAVDISDIEIDKTSDGFKELMSVTKDMQTSNMKLQNQMNQQNMQAQNAINVKNMADTQRINAENTEATLKAQREEAQYAQHMQTDMNGFALHQLNAQRDVGIASANAFGKMGENGGTSAGGVNPVGMMAGMAMGGTIAKNMSGMMNNMMGGMQQPMMGAGGMGMNMPGMQQSGMTPPPVPPQAAYNVAVNGQSTGPFDAATLKQMAANGQFTAQSQVWKAGMSSWQPAGQVPDLAQIFSSQMPPPPPAN